MSKLPNHITSVRINKVSYERFKQFCEDRGLLAPKQIGFILDGIMENQDLFDLVKAGWKRMETEFKYKQELNAKQEEHDE